MTKNEALKAAIDGKKIRNKLWGSSALDFIWFDGRQFLYGHRHQGCFVPAKCAMDSEEDWEIVPEYVDFAEAWKAYESGKAIQSTISGAKYKQNRIGGQMFITDIRGKWLILEDE